MWEHMSITQHLGGRGKASIKLKSTLVLMVSSKPTRATQQDCVSKYQKQINPKKNTDPSWMALVWHCYGVGWHKPHGSAKKALSF